MPPGVQCQPGWQTCPGSQISPGMQIADFVGGGGAGHEDGGGEPGDEGPGDDGGIAVHPVNSSSEQSHARMGFAPKQPTPCSAREAEPRLTEPG